MSEKNFKIGTSGLDLDGGLLSTNVLSNAISFNGNLLASEEYVTNALAGVDTDLSDNAGLHLSWNAGSTAFDVNVNSLVGDIAGSGLYVSGNDLTVNVNAIVGDLDGEGLYFNNNQLAINTNVVVTLTGAQDISNKKIIDTLYFSDGVTVSEEGEIAVKATTHEFEIKANYGDLDLKTVATDGITGSNVNISSLHGDIVLNANGASYIGSVAEGNQITTKSYVDGIVNTNAIAGSLASSTLYVDSADNLNVNVNAIVGDLDGTGLYVDGFTLAVNTNAIATKAYVDSVAQGLDVKASVKVASTANIAVGTFDYTAGNVDEIALNPGDRVLLKNQTAASENGIYVADPSSTALVRAADADNLTDLTQGAFTFVENGTVNAGKGFVLSALLATGEVLASIAIQTWTQFSEAGSLTAGSNIYLSSGSINVNVNSLVGDLDGTGLYVDGTTLAVNVNALAGTGLTVNGNQLEAAPAFITTTDASFAVTDGELSLSDNITIASVELTDSVNNVTAASDVFGNGSTSAYDMGSNETIGTLPAAYEVADVFVTLESSTGASRTSKFTHVNTGGDAPTWTEYGIIVSGSFPATTISFDASGNVIANVTGSATYSAKGVATILK
jgi:hypothetical protein